MAPGAEAEVVTAVYGWVTTDRDDTPASHLKNFGHFDLSAAAEATMQFSSGVDTSGPGYSSQGAQGETASRVHPAAYFCEHRDIPQRTLMNA